MTIFVESIKRGFVLRKEFCHRGRTDGRKTNSHVGPQCLLHGHISVKVAELSWWVITSGLFYMAQVLI